MTVKELIEELQSYDPALQVVTCDGHGSVDEIHFVTIEKINDHDDIVVDWNEGVVNMLVLGWNQ